MRLNSTRCTEAISRAASTTSDLSFLPLVIQVDRQQPANADHVQHPEAADIGGSRSDRCHPLVCDTIPVISINQHHETREMLDRPFTVAELRALDRRAVEEYGLPGIVLMENAGRNAAALLRTRGASTPVVICCGKGNNGGDGLVIARHLDAAGIGVRILFAVDPATLTGDAAINLRVVQASGLSLKWVQIAAEWSTELSVAMWIVDALLGTGLTGPVRAPFVTPMTAINAAGKPVLAVDLPSGFDADAGRPWGDCVRATETVTFAARKVGFDQPDAAKWTGPVTVCDIGAPRQLLEAIRMSAHPAIEP